MVDGRFLFCLHAVAGTRHDAEWASNLGDDIEAIVYQQDDQNQSHYYSRHGNEAGAYLQFMIDYYDCLPNVSFSLKDLIPSPSSSQPTLQCMWKPARQKHSFDCFIWEQGEEETIAVYYFCGIPREKACRLPFTKSIAMMLQVTAFVHGHEAEGWHNFNMRDTFSGLRWNKIPGYTGTGATARSSFCPPTSSSLELDLLSQHSAICRSLFSSCSHEA